MILKKSIIIVMVLGAFQLFSDYRPMNNNAKGGSMIIESSTFKNNQPIPKKYTCQEEDISPMLNFKNIPQQAISLVLICDDPDAPSKTWVHWVVYNVPINVSKLPENANIKAMGGLEGSNDFGKTTYGGPCPPIGHGVHRYFFKLYALDKKLDLKAGATKQEVVDAMNGHILAQAQLIGTYERK